MDIKPELTGKSETLSNGPLCCYVLSAAQTAAFVRLFCCFVSLFSALIVRPTRLYFVVFVFARAGHVADISFSKPVRYLSLSPD